MAEGRNHQAHGPAATFGEGPRVGIGQVSELLDEAEDLLSLLGRDRSLAAQRVGDRASRHAGPARDLSDVGALRHLTDPEVSPETMKRWANTNTIRVGTMARVEYAMAVLQSVRVLLM